MPAPHVPKSEACDYNSFSQRELTIFRSILGISQNTSEKKLRLTIEEPRYCRLAIRILA